MQKTVRKCFISSYMRVKERLKYYWYYVGFGMRKDACSHCHKYFYAFLSKIFQLYLRLLKNTVSPTKKLKQFQRQQRKRSKQLFKMYISR